MTESDIRIVLVYPSLLGTYGDGGNAEVLQHRLGWRGIGAEIVSPEPGNPLPSSGDVYLLGGGEDEAQTSAARALGSGVALRQAVDRGAQVLAVCAGLQLLGVCFEAESGRVQAGLGLLDLTTSRLGVRAVGEALVDADPQLGLEPLTGFENHSGATVLGPQARPLGVVRRGRGNGDPGGDANRRVEGALQGNIIATYLHGPVLARNPGLADVLLSRVLGGPLEPLRLPEVDLLRRQRLAAARSRRRPR